MPLWNIGFGVKIMSVYKITDRNLKGDKMFIVLSGKVDAIKEKMSVRDENGNVFYVKSVIPLCAGCTACFDTMLNVDIVETKGEFGKEIYAE